MPASTPSPATSSVKERIVETLKRVPFERAIEQPDFRELLKQDAETGDAIYSDEALEAFQEARELRHAKRVNPTPGAFFSNKSVMIVPGFMGSQLRDDGSTGNGLIWLDPKVYITPSQLSALRLAGLPAQGAGNGRRGRRRDSRRRGAADHLRRVEVLP